jgi:hypothetical protein
LSIKDVRLFSRKEHLRRFVTSLVGEGAHSLH